MGQPPNEPAAAAPPRHPPLFLAGVVIFLLGIAAVFLQIQLKHLTRPWAMPMLGTAGVLLMLAGAWQRRSALRWVGLVPFLLLCGFAWYLLTVASRVPESTGPAKPGSHVPAFTAALADGQPFTDKDLEDGSSSLMIFFRGRW